MSSSRTEYSSGCVSSERDTYRSPGTASPRRPGLPIIRGSQLQVSGRSEELLEGLGVVLGAGVAGDEEEDEEEPGERGGPHLGTWKRHVNSASRRHMSRVAEALFLIRSPPRHRRDSLNPIKEKKSARCKALGSGEAKTRSRLPPIAAAAVASASPTTLQRVDEVSARASLVGFACISSHFTIRQYKLLRERGHGRPLQNAEEARTLFCSYLTVSTNFKRNEHKAEPWT